MSRGRLLNRLGAQHYDKEILDSIRRLGCSAEHREIERRLCPHVMSHGALEHQLRSLVRRHELAKFPPEEHGTCRCETCEILRHELKIPRDGLRRRRPIYVRMPGADEIMAITIPWINRLLVEVQHEIERYAMNWMRSPRAGEAEMGPKYVGCGIRQEEIT